MVDDRMFSTRRRIVHQLAKETLVRDILVWEGIPFSAPCNGQGTCGKCLLRVFGNLNPPTVHELKHIEPTELAVGFRLACQARAIGELIIELPDNNGSTNHIMSDGLLSLKELKPLHQLVSIEKPAIMTWANVKSQFHTDLEPTLNVLQKIPQIPKAAKQLWISILGEKIIDIVTEPPGSQFGVAVDIGTTTLVAYLVDYNHGAIIKTASVYNPQSSYGLDVITRIEMGSKPEGLIVLHDLIIKAIRELIWQRIQESGITENDILQVNLVGNTSMTHILLKIDPSSLGQIPFNPSFIDIIELTTFELALPMNQAGIITILPGIGGFVGSDISAGVMICDLSPDKTELFIDIGTNGEIVITGKGKMLACSTAAGPTFEGAKISCGNDGQNRCDHGSTIWT